MNLDPGAPSSATTADAVPGPEPLLRVEGLAKAFSTRRGTLKAVDGVSFDLHEGRTLGLVGESGCGKSTTARLILRLIEPTSGSVRYRGRELTDLPASAMRRMRRELGIVFQDPYASLNPRLILRSIVGEGLRVWEPGADIDRRVGEMLERVGLDPAFARRYPTRCPRASERCAAEEPALALRGLDHPVACHFAADTPPPRTGG